MTILNVWVSPERALVGTDTAIMENGRRIEVNKMAAIPAMGAVVAVSGTRHFQRHLEGQLFDAHGTFDDLLAAMPHQLREAWQGAVQEARSMPGMPALPEANSVLTVGYSARLGRVLGRWYHQFTAARGFADVLDIDEGAICMPGPSTGWPALGALPQPATAESMAAYARRQVQFTRDVIAKEVPGAYAGGRVIIAEITGGWMTIRAAGEL